MPGNQTSIVLAQPHLSGLVFLVVAVAVVICASIGFILIKKRYPKTEADEFTIIEE